MYNLWEILKGRDEPPTSEEIDIACGKKQLDGKTEAEYQESLRRSEGMHSSNNFFFAPLLLIEVTLQGPWDQDKFEQLLTEWVVACNQPFDEVEKPKFVNLMEYTHCARDSFKMLKRDGIKHRIMKKGDEMIEGNHEMFLV